VKGYSSLNMENDNQQNNCEDAGQVVDGAGEVVDNGAGPPSSSPVLVRSYATGEYARNIFAFIRYVRDAYNYMIQHERKRFERSFDLATDVMNYMIQEEEWEGGAGISQLVLDNYWSMHMIRF
jgi:hypothetical protein